MATEKLKDNEIRSLPEKIIFKNSRGLNLVGDFYTSGSDSVIVMCHGLAYDRSTSGRFDKAAKLFNERGFNVFKFDFSGCGESDYDTLTTDKQIDDLENALRYVANKGLKKIGLIGHSFGGFISLKIRNKGIRTMVLWAPVTNAAIDPENYYGIEGLEQLKDKGIITKMRTGTLREKTDIDGKLFKEWKNINQKELLASIKIPVFIIHGNKDARLPLGDSKSAMQYLSSESRLQIIDGADHYLEIRLDDFVDKTADWFKMHL